jgi:hypothetical protein
MYVHNSNTVINILRVTETHILSRYRQEWSEAPRPWLSDRAARHDLVHIVYSSTAACSMYSCSTLVQL